MSLEMQSLMPYLGNSPSYQSPILGRGRRSLEPDTGAIDELLTTAELEEVSSLEQSMGDIDELLTLALQPRKDHLGGVDSYLAKKLCEKRPEDIKVAMSRLCLGLNHSVPVRLASSNAARAKSTPIGEAAGASSPPSARQTPASTRTLNAGGSKPHS